MAYNNTRMHFDTKAGIEDESPPKLISFLILNNFRYSF